MNIRLSCLFNVIYTRFFILLSVSKSVLKKNKSDSSPSWYKYCTKRRFIILYYIRNTVSIYIYIITIIIYDRRGRYGRLDIAVVIIPRDGFRVRVKRRLLYSCVCVYRPLVHGHLLGRFGRRSRRRWYIYCTSSEIRPPNIIY